MSNVDGYQLMADDSIEQEGFDFIRLSASFLALVKCFAVTLGLPYATTFTIPFGSVFRSWQRCVLLKVPICSHTTISGRE
jgi:hypothetical protein